MVCAIDLVLLQWLAKCQKVQAEEVMDLSENDLDEGGDENNGEGNEKNEKDNHIEITASGSIVVSGTACVTNQVSKNLLKLQTDAAKTPVEQSADKALHKCHLSELAHFCNLQKDAVSHSS